MPAGAEQDLATRAVAAVGVRCDAVEMEYLRQGFKVADVAAVMPLVERFDIEPFSAFSAE